MDELSVKVGKGEVKIDRSVFLSLLDISPVQASALYRNTLSSDRIRFSDLKELASKAEVPYPLFFAPETVVTKHLKDKENNLFNKLPSKAEMRLVTRGFFDIKDVELIVKDLGRKQEFLKRRVLSRTTNNPFIGYVAKDVKGPHMNKQLADKIRSYLGIDLADLRTKSKAGVVNYIRDCAEHKGILVSFSSYNFMPQNLDPNLGLSGLCVKDKKFPFIFVNTRDGDEKPKILESDGRQIFTLVAMLVCIALNRFIFSTKGPKKGDPILKKVYLIVGEILIPREDLKSVTIANLDDLKRESTKFKVTPSMLLVRLRECQLIEKELGKRLRAELIAEAKSIPSSPKYQPTQTTGYGKYNGTRLSQEVIRANRGGRISLDEVKNILFRKGKMNANLLSEYSEKYK